MTGPADVARGGVYRKSVHVYVHPELQDQRLLVVKSFQSCLRNG